MIDQNQTRNDIRLEDTSSPPSPRAQIGAMLGKYQLTGMLGEGASGQVFRSFHHSLNVPVAIKVIHPTAADRDRAIYQQLRSEARLLAQLNHPHLIRVWDFEDDPVEPFLVMELVEGMNLEELINQSGRLSPERAVVLVRQVASGLAAAHKVGIIHRDVKPRNILLNRAGEAKLADLGLAVAPGQLEHRTGDPVVGSVPEGTAAYMAPEQFLAPTTVDHRADIYSLGATFFHAVTGRLPFEARTASAVLLKHAREPLTPPHTLITNLHEAVSDVIVAMMAKDPDDRIMSYDELIPLLNGLAQTLGVTGDQGSMSSTRSSTRSGVQKLSSHGSRTRTTMPEFAPPPMTAPNVFGPEPPSATVSELLQEADSALRAGQRTTARKLLTEVVRADVRSEIGWLWLAEVSASPKDAVACLQRVLELNPNHQSARQKLLAARLDAAGVEAAAGNSAKARQLLLDATEQDPFSEAAWLALADVAANDEEAVTALRQVLRLNPANARAASRYLALSRDVEAAADPGQPAPPERRPANVPPALRPAPGSTLSPRVRQAWEQTQRKFNYPVNALGVRIKPGDEQTMSVWKAEGIERFMRR